MVKETDSDNSNRKGLRKRGKKQKSNTYRLENDKNIAEACDEIAEQHQRKRWACNVARDRNMTEARMERQLNRMISAKEDKSRLDPSVRDSMVDFDLMLTECEKLSVKAH